MAIYKYKYNTGTKTSTMCCLSIIVQLYAIKTIANLVRTFLSWKNLHQTRQTSQTIGKQNKKKKKKGLWEPVTQRA